MRHFYGTFIIRSCKILHLKFLNACMICTIKLISEKCALLPNVDLKKVYAILCRKPLLVHNKNGQLNSKR